MHRFIPQQIKLQLVTEDFRPFTPFETGFKFSEAKKAPARTAVE
jgi:hypothetical protein